MEAGPGWLVQRWSRDDGIPANNVADVVQTPDGMVWLATYGGLVRFDGLTFEVVDTSAARLPANVFTAVTVAPDGWLWAATENHGLLSLRGGIIRGHPESASAFIESPEGLWVGSFHGLYAAVDGDLRSLSPPTPGPVFGAARDARGQLWLGLGGLGLARVVGDRVVRESPPMPLGNVRTLTRDGPRLWLTAARGLFTIDEAGLRRHPASGSAGFHSLEVVGQARFAGTDEGVVRVTPDRMVPVESPADRGAVEAAVRRPAAALADGTPVIRGQRILYLDQTPILRADSRLRALRVGLRGEVWVTTATGDLLRVSRRRIEAPPGAEGNVYGLLEDRQRDLWAATLDRGVLRFRQGRPVPASAPDGHAWTLAEAPDGAIWIGAYGLCRLVADGCDPVPEVADEQIRALHFDRRGQLWIGAAAGLYLRADGVTRRAFPPDQGPRQPVRVFYESPDG
ncbi:MAG: hypothetical protein KC549_18750, partial [Myxococcales bacterium]|nr:hypothetical protein [Myxococcales bacterium]